MSNGTVSTFKDRIKAILEREKRPLTAAELKDFLGVGSVASFHKILVRNFQRNNKTRTWYFGDPNMNTKVVHLMKHGQKLRVGIWLNDHAKEIKEKNLTLEKTWEMLVQETKLEVSPVNVRQVAKHLGITFPHRNSGRKTGNGKAYGERQTIIAKNLLALAVEVGRICQNLGEKFDPNQTIQFDKLHAIATKLSIQEGVKS